MKQIVACWETRGLQALLLLSKADEWHGGKEKHNSIGNYTPPDLSICVASVPGSRSRLCCHDTGFCIRLDPSFN